MRMRVWGLGPMLVALVACGSSGDQPGGGGGDAVGHFLSALSSGDGSVVGQLRSGSLPGGSGPSVQAAMSGAVLPGAATLATVSSGSAIDRVVVGVQGADGYYELSGLTSGASQSLRLTIAQSAPTSFSFLVAGGSGGSVGGSTTLPVNLTSVGTGDVQVSVTWDVDSDVDLHVVDPSGEEIYYGNKTSASGGQLDLDSNAACSLDHKRAENITWPTGKAPNGHYIVLVDYWDACGQAATNYVVTVNKKGAAPVTFTHSLSGSGDQGGECHAQPQPVCGAVVTSFDVP